MNWGYRILVIYSLFVIGILFMVYKCSQQNIDLVAENYYDEEIKYQGRLDDTKNGQEIKYKLLINKNSDNKSIDIQYPEAIEAGNIKGSIVFFKPDNAKLDFSIPINAGNEHIQQIPTDQLARGLWKMQISWKSDSINIYQEEKIILK